MTSQKVCHHLLEIIEDFPNHHVVVFGDVIADEFVYGQISRVSREAPVLVLDYRELVRVPGGAGNAANNLLDLGCRVTVVGALGDDDAGRDLRAILALKGADVRQVATPASYVTPVKTRILAGAHHSTRQQIVRLDRGALLKPGSYRPEPAEAITGADAVILSDYGFGVVTQTSASEVAALAAGNRIPVMVDSRFRMGQFRDVTAITPNITELEASVGRAIGGDAALLRKTGTQVLLRQRLQFLLVTQGRFGMTLFQRRKPPLHIPIYGTDDVADVTGAGDTVIAVFTAALACGASGEDAARLANYAGGIVVMKRGTATVTPKELEEAIKCDLHFDIVPTP
jgi:D-glycero-beta-D-manno-heptose-7-phosphate kinase